MQEAKEPSQKIKNIFECKASCNEPILNRATGDVVTRDPGPRGPTSVHTPESVTRAVTTFRIRARIDSTKRASDSLWKLNFRPQA
jgi:hypothetical protein